MPTHAPKDPTAAAAYAALAEYGPIKWSGEQSGEQIGEWSGEQIGEGIDLRALAEAGTESLIQPLGDGLINDTFLVEAAGGFRAVLQRVNPIFAPRVHEDIEAITRHLANKGLVTPRLLRTAAGGLFVELGEAEGRPRGVWRLMTFVPGHCFAGMTLERAAPAGELVGRFHAALLDLEHSFRFSRPGAHDLQRHLGVLRAALDKAQTPEGEAALGAERAQFLSLAQEILLRAEELPVGVPGPLRLCHGDLKLNNLRFDDQGRGVCLLDLDTLAQLPLGLELGDALRSWCNPRGEEDADARFELPLLEAALAGYAVHARGFLLPEERGFLITGIERVALQLAARFGADAVNQSYFRWSPQRFKSRAAHNVVRARSQLQVAATLGAQRERARGVVERIFG